MTWPWNDNQPHLFNPPPPFPPPPLPHLSPHSSPPYPPSTAIPFGSFAQPYAQPPPPHLYPSQTHTFIQSSLPQHTPWVPYPVAQYMLPHTQQAQVSPQQQWRRRAPQDPRRRAVTERERRKEVVRGLGKQGGERGGGNGMRDGSVRDLAMSRAMLQKMGVSLPENEAEVEKWVSERKRNWPSRVNVERKLREREKRKREEMAKDGRSAVSRLAEDYVSSEEEVEEEGVDRKKRKNEGKKLGKDKVGRVRKCRRRGRGRKGEKAVKTGLKEGRQSLLKQLLQKEIDRESSVLLQAFAYIVRKKAEESV